MGIFDAFALNKLNIEDQLEAALKRLRSGAKKSLSTQRNELTVAYRAEKLVFVLGAGVSLDYGLPAWSVLLQELLIRTLGDSKAGDAEQSGKLAKAYTEFFKPSPLMAARYTRLKLKERFIDAVREVLYARGVVTDKDSDLMKAIRNFAVAAGRSPNLDSIITFNFDDLLEQCIDRVPIPAGYQVIDDDKIRPTASLLPIYHVHGYLPRDPSLRAQPSITLSEDDYHARYSDIYHWSNIVQINKFRENTCLFIGLSFSDPNLRRLLDIAQRQRGDKELQHYLVRKRFTDEEAATALQALGQPQPDDGTIKEPNDPEATKRLVKKLVSFMEQVDEEDAASFGVSVIWVNDFSELTALLGQIYSGKPPEPAAVRTITR